MDDPEFEGFGFGEDATSLRDPRVPLGLDFGPDDIPTKGRGWTVARMSPSWSPQPVFGLVRPYNDYPCVNLSIPAFSRRAVDALRDFLEPNGELLPLVSSAGEYYAYNITTVADVLDHTKSEIKWYDDRHDIALRVLRYECHPERLAGLSIFRLVEKPAYAFVHQVFVDRVRQHDLKGFDFTRLYSAPTSGSDEKRILCS